MTNVKRYELADKIVQMILADTGLHVHSIEYEDHQTECYTAKAAHRSGRVTLWFSNEDEGEKSNG